MLDNQKEPENVFYAFDFLGTLVTLNSWQKSHVNAAPSAKTIVSLPIYMYSSWRKNVRILMRLTMSDRVEFVLMLGPSL